MNVFDKILNINYEKGMGITGATDEFFCVYLSKLSKKKNILLVVSSLYEANKLYSSIQNYTNNVFLFPMDDFLTSEAIAISPDLMVNRLETLNEIIKNKNMIVITNLMGYLRFLPEKDLYKKSFIDLKVGMEIEPEKLVEKLINVGYKVETIVTKTGEVGIRGFIIDVFPIGEENPVRIEFFGDEIDSIRYFSPASQKSIEKVKKITIKPFSEFITSKRLDNASANKQKLLPEYEHCVNISNYIDDSIVIYKDYSQLEVNYHQIFEECNTYHETKDEQFNGKYMFSLDEISEKEFMYYLSINNASSKIQKSLIKKFNVHTISNFKENVSLINDYLTKEINNNKTIIICLPKDKIRRVIKLLNCKIIETDEEHIEENKINIIEQNLSEGFEIDNYIFLSSHELFKEKTENKKYKTRFKYASKIKDINSIEVGDYVVHNAHGIGMYNGIKVLTSNGIAKDYIEVLYKGTDKLYIPVEKIDLLSKYVGKEGVVPKINKMDSIEWKKTKARVTQKVKDMADKLLNLYAERESKKGFAFSKDGLLMEEFEKDCPFKLTTDQQIAVSQIKGDMEDDKPMDRLLCGDVGFGKTEVAFRAIFKAIVDSKQVLLLCPTTILSDQHYKNALKRFENFPVNIELLNRFTTEKETKRIKAGLLDGTIDLVIGTHRLLSRDIEVKNLGLLVIDEEQRFGVLHKERIKEYKTNIDVLTLTATPIPRTLQMSMVGIRSLSLIETPPVDRYPIQTYVVEENDQLIRDAIYKELSRNGQIFILFNSVEKIQLKVEKIKKLAPDAKVDFAHGQMNKTTLENKMINFVNKEFDILVCTTIIETGIDIPNVNTLIILDADRFGLSQLYQIRGRVGRSNKFAYAYLMYNPQKVLTETAVKRLNVIKEFTELGSGFSIATRDLSIRGAGDILGSEQAGFIDTVGIELYLKMLDNEVERRKGKLILEEDESEDSNKQAINISTHIKDEYVLDEKLKIEIHKKINEIDSKKKLLKVKEEIEDRFGKIDDDMYIYMYSEWFEKQIKQINVKKVNQTKNYIELIFSKDLAKYLDMEELFIEAFRISTMFRFKSKESTISIILDTIKLDKHPIYYLTDLLDYILTNFNKGID